MNGITNLRSSILYPVSSCYYYYYYYLIRLRYIPEYTCRLSKYHTHARAPTPRLKFRIYRG